MIPSGEPCGNDQAGNFTLFPHQRVAVSVIKAMLRRHRGALLADEPGMGKTLTALAVARGYQRVQVVAPAVLLDMWREVGKRVGSTFEAVSYERLSALHGVPHQRPALLILDEAHCARNSATRRYRAVAHLAWGAHVLLLSATPIHNRRRDLTSLLSLFLGSAADSLSDQELAQFIVRRRVEDELAPGRAGLPALGEFRWETIPPAPEVVNAVLALPPAATPADGGRADALLRLTLLRAWCSSDAALIDALTRRLATAVALEHALSHGRHPTRMELRSWLGGQDAVQLGFAELLAAGGASDPFVQISEVRAHADAVRALRAQLRDPPRLDGSAFARDEARFERVREVLRAHASRRAVVFTHSRATALAAYRALSASTRVGLLTGAEGRIASGAVPREWLLDSFRACSARPRDKSALQDSIARVDVLVASDVVSEGVNLPDVSLVLHLDLPWTPARLEQRVGRARRIGSPHADVLQFGIGPPFDAGELDVVVRHLAQKAGLAQQVIGSRTPLLDGRTPPPLRPSDDGLGATGAVERLRKAADRIWALVDTACPGTLPVRLALSGGPDRIVAIGLAERCDTRDVSAARERTRALVVLMGRELRVLTSEADAGELAAVVPAVGVRLAPELLPTPPVTSALDGWCSARNASEVSVASMGQRSRIHGEVLRHIERLVHRAQRFERGAVLELASAARRAVLGTSGVGGEFALSSLAETAPGLASSDASRREWLRRLREVLGERAHDGASDESRWRIRGVAVRGTNPNE